MILCSFDGCTTNAHSRGWCHRHYYRWWKNGDPGVTLIKGTRSGEIPKFINDAIAYLGDECVFWPFNRNNKGYPQIGNGNGSTRLAHRIVCRAVHGEPPDDKPFSAHSCGNGHLACVTPAHLRWASHADNMAEMSEHGRSTRGQKSFHAKLTDERVAEIFRRARAGENQRIIAAEFGIEQTLVSMIKLGKRWRWLTGVDTETLKRQAGVNG